MIKSTPSPTYFYSYTLFTNNNARKEFATCDLVCFGRSQCQMYLGQLEICNICLK